MSLPLEIISLFPLFICMLPPGRAGASRLFVLQVPVALIAQLALGVLDKLLLRTRGSMTPHCRKILVVAATILFNLRTELLKNEFKCKQKIFFLFTIKINHIYMYILIALFRIIWVFIEHHVVLLKQINSNHC